ncbi:hypothetical protein PAT3040_02628 [Paenibacillus agaridevorans]|uniref:Uncharacterized protein n=1 Tax=Paenibacillus agaridevorans TaxID=171404 RepID=A0A2R5EXI5_9BACL|nr:hypothetical protein PAT3040_02628 [Paenibacillus agaridevorans]
MHNRTKSDVKGVSWLMNETIARIISQCEKLSEDEMNMVTDGLSRGFDRRIQN